MQRLLVTPSMHLEALNSKPDWTKVDGIEAPSGTRRWKDGGAGGEDGGSNGSGGGGGGEGGGGDGGGGDGGDAGGRQGGSTGGGSKGGGL
eukprot:2667614-Prymnesium_polylepis.1